MDVLATRARVTMTRLYRAVTSTLLKTNQITQAYHRATDCGYHRQICRTHDISLRIGNVPGERRFVGKKGTFLLIASVKREMDHVVEYHPVQSPNAAALSIRLPVAVQTTLVSLDLSVGIYLDRF